MNQPHPNQSKKFGDERPGGPGRGRRPLKPRATDEYQDRVLELRRVTRVVAGGKRFRFRATVVIGDLRGRVGVGIGKGADVQSAIAKGRADAKKHVMNVPLTGQTIPHEVEAKFSAARVRLKPAVKGHGLKAGGAVRVVLTLAGVKDIVAKALGGTSNKLTNALATIAALKKIKTKKHANPSVTAAK